MDLGNGSRGQWMFIKTMEDLFDRLVKGTFNNVACSFPRERRNTILKPGEFFSDVLG